MNVMNLEGRGKKEIRRGFLTSSVEKDGQIGAFIILRLTGEPEGNPTHNGLCSVMDGKLSKMIFE